MSKYIIKGGEKLSGEVNISGSKNASLPILAASILNRKKVKLYNVPDISDVRTTCEILESLGCKIEKINNVLIIDSEKMENTVIPDDLMRKLRSSVILAGAILARFKKVSFSLPGGCDIGTRPIDLHLKNFKKIGIKISENSRYIECICDKIESKTIELDFPSVGATENLILASIYGNHEIIINNAAMEPEIVDLANFLNKLGAKIYGAGTNIIKVLGVKKLKELASYTIMPDRIEAGTFLVAGAITKGSIKINKVNTIHLGPVISKLKECGCEILTDNNCMYINGNKNTTAVDIKTMPYPGFPTDLQPIFSTYLTICKGTSIVTENIFENRFKFMQEIKRMGAKVKFESNSIIIKGIKRLHPANLECTDLRGGAAMVLAALNSDGVSEISKLDYLFRGYENFDIKLKKLGANITREEN